MDGKTAFISRGAEIAFSRGMIVVNSAGNEGNVSWRYISAPADAASVLSIGAVNATGVIASFSSYGPTSDNRVKPDVCAQGAGVYIINPSGAIATSNGTSFSSPVLTGVVACLWQAFPTKSNAEIIKMVKESAHLYNSPTAQEGYGIPNFESIFNLLNVEETEEILEVVAYPNPAITELKFKFPNQVTEMELVIYSVLGKRLQSEIITKLNPTTDISNLAQGLYFVQLKFEDKIKTIKILIN
jgi:hypothetical protein